MARYKVSGIEFGSGESALAMCELASRDRVVIPKEVRRVLNWIGTESSSRLLAFLKEPGCVTFFPSIAQENFKNDLGIPSSGKVRAADAFRVTAVLRPTSIDVAGRLQLDPFIKDFLSIENEPSETRLVALAYDDRLELLSLPYYRAFAMEAAKDIDADDLGYGYAGTANDLAS